MESPTTIPSLLSLFSNRASNKLSDSGGTTTISKYYSAAGQRLAMRTGNTLSYLLSDDLGSSTIALSSTGSVVAVQLFAPFGTSRYSLGTMPTTYNFTGQRLDSETGLLSYGARYYDPFSARFIQADKVQNNAGGMDPYAYVGENPETYIDPLGEFYAPPGRSGSQTGPVYNDCYQPSCDGGGIAGEGGGGEGGGDGTDPGPTTGRPPETNPDNGNVPSVDPITPEEGAQLDAAIQEEEQLVNELKTAERQFGNELDLQPGEQVSDLNPDETAPNGPESQPNTSSNATKVYRVQGGTTSTGTPGSQFRLTVTPDGNIQINDNGMLHLNFGDQARAQWWLNNRGPTSQLVSFDVTNDFVAQLRELAVPQSEARQFPGFPQIDDPANRDFYGNYTQFGIPSTMFEWLLESIIPGSGIITNFDDPVP